MLWVYFDVESYKSNKLLRDPVGIQFDRDCCFRVSMNLTSWSAEHVQSFKVWEFPGGVFLDCSQVLYWTFYCVNFSPPVPHFLLLANFWWSHNGGKWPRSGGFFSLSHSVSYLCDCVIIEHQTVYELATCSLNSMVIFPLCFAKQFSQVLCIKKKKCGFRHIF